MSDVHAVSSEPNSDVEEGHHQPSPTNNTPVPTSSQRQNLGAFGALGSRNAPQVGESSGANTSNIRRSGLPVQVGSSSLTRRHSVSATDFGRINEEIPPEARRMAAEFTAALQLPPIDHSSPESALRGHQMQLAAMTEAIHGVFETIAQAEGSGGGVTIQPIADTPEIRAAQADLNAKTEHAETLESDAQAKRGAATELRSAADEALEQAKTAHTAHGEAQRVAQAKNEAATKAEAAATKAVEAAKAKAGEAATAQKTADAAQAHADALGGKASEAETAADKAQTTADNKTNEARDAEKAADGANQVAQDQSDAATGAQEHADNLRAKAEQLAAAVETTPEKDRPAAQAKAVEADKEASQAERAAQDAKTAAGQAAEHAAQLKSEALTQKTQAGELQAQAAKAKATAQEARTSASEASKAAATLSREANAIGKEAQALKARAEELTAKAGPLRTEADKASEQADKAGEVARETKRLAQEADAKADGAEEEAGQAEDAAHTAREDAEAAGRTLQEAIENAPVQTETGDDAADAASSSHRASTATNDAAHTGDAATPAGTDNAARTGNTTWAQIGKNWALNSVKIVGQQAVSVGVTTALREAVGAGVEALLTHTHASDEVKAGIAGGLYGSVILANLMAMLYHERQGIGNPTTHAGNIAQIVSLSAAVTAAATTGTLKDLVPSLMKTFQYSGGRDIGNLYLPLGDNVPEGKVSPLTVQAINFFFYSANQMLVNSVQSFHGVSGQGLVDAMQQNKTDPNTGEAETLRSGFASLATYVVANLAGEAADQFTGRMLNNALSGGKLADLQVSLTADGWPGAEKAFDTFAADGVSRTSIFYTVYGLSAAANPQITPPHFGERGAPWLQNFVGAAFIALLCLPAVMTAMKNKRNSGGTTGGRAMEEGDPRITSVSTPPGTPPRNETDEITLRDQGGGTSGNRRATGSDTRV
jgi:hypothetical protein